MGRFTFELAGCARWCRRSVGGMRFAQPSS